MTEKQLHKSICDFIKYQYPKIIFNTDASGLKLTIGQSVQIKKLRSSNGFPDIVIYEQSQGYWALFLEVKIETPFKKDGKLKSNKHLEEQNEMHKKLRLKGYKVEFVWTFDNAVKLIRDYLK